MGAVYRAWDLTLDRPVALKVNESYEEGSQDQFEREARILARLRHANLPAILDHFIAPDGKQCLVMEFIEGENLDHVIKTHPHLDTQQALGWIEKVCDAVTYLHAQNPPILHRDIKPANIKITPEGEVFLVDFGLAKVGDAAVMTSTGARGVTPGFSPPEQYGAGGTDARSDVYALGATLYALLTGTTPAESILRSIGAATLTAPRQIRAGIPDRVASAIESAMQTSPSERPQTVRAFRTMLQASAAMNVVDDPKPTVAPPASQTPEIGTRAPRRGHTGSISTPLKAAGAAVLVLGLIGILVGSLWSRTHADEAPPSTASANSAAPAATRTATPPEAAKEPTSGAPGTAIAASDEPKKETPRPLSPKSPTSTPTSAEPPETPAATATTPQENTPVAAFAAAQDCPGVAATFLTAWEAADGQIGCNTSQPWVTEIAEQTFDGGWMYWRKDTDRIYVVSTSGTWGRYTHAWTTAKDAYTCADANTPARNPPTPIMGFGEVWCTQAGVRASLGWATKAEVYYDATLQTFEHGYMMQTKSGTWLFYDTGQWERR